MDLYSILGVKKDADEKEIRTAYRRLAMKHHPDRNGGKESDEFRKIQEAYEILSDPKRRETYDRTGNTSAQVKLDDRAKSIISSMYLSLASQENFARKDYILEITKSLQNSYRQCNSDKSDLEQAHKRLQYLIDNTAADEKIIDPLQLQLGEISQRIEQAKDGLVVMGRALEIVSECRYTGTVPEASPIGTKWGLQNEWYI